MYNSFVNAIIDIINKYQNSRNCFTEISVRDIVFNEFNKKYTVISDGRFTFYVSNSHIRYIINESTRNIVDFNEWKDNTNQLIVVQMLYGM